MTEYPPATPWLYLRAGLFWTGLALSTVLFALFSPLLLPLKWHGRFRVLSQWTRFNLWWLTLTCGLRYTVTGTEHLGGEARVLMCKHQSAWETLALQQFIPPQAWVLKRELMRIPFFGWALGMLEPIALDRAAGRKAMDQLVAQGLDRLDRGLWVVLFPGGNADAARPPGPLQGGWGGAGGPQRSAGDPGGPQCGPVLAPQQLPQVSGDHPGGGRAAHPHRGQKARGHHEGCPNLDRIPHCGAVRTVRVGCESLP